MRNDHVPEPFRPVPAERQAPDAQREIPGTSSAHGADKSSGEPFISQAGGSAATADKAALPVAPAHQPIQETPADPGLAPLVRPPWNTPQHPSLAHVPWEARDSWGATTLTVSASTAAGVSYLFWWVSGFLIYFGERNNRFVRFHALQSIILTGVLTILSVSDVLFAAIMQDLTRATNQMIFYHLGIWGSALLALAIVFTWLCVMIAAWMGNYLRLPVIGPYAERYSAPPLGTTGHPFS